MFRIAFLVIGLCMLTSPLFAEEQRTGGGDEDMAARVELAQEMHDIWPTRDRVQKAIKIATQSVPPEEQAAFEEVLSFTMDYAAIEAKSIEAMARTFSLEELQAMVAYYGSDIGRSAEGKRDDYIKVLTPEISGYVDKAIMTYRYGAGAEAVPKTK